MNKFLVCSQFQLLLFSFVLITACNGQEKKNPRENLNIPLNTIPDDTSVKENQPAEQNIETPWVDPLFFIDGQLCQHLRKMYQDRGGNLWFGTNVYGLMRYNGDTLEYFDEKDGIGRGRITGIVEDKDGHVWFGTSGGVSKYDPLLAGKQGKSFTNFTEKDGLVNNEVWSIILDSNGIFWIGTMEGVSRFDGEEFTPFPIPKAHVNDTTSILSYNRISCILEDKKGTIWFGTDGFGITRYDALSASRQGQSGFTNFTKEDGLCDNNIGHFLEDKKGNIWIGTMYGGLSRYDGESFTNYTQDGVISGIEVGGLFEDKNGNIWFAAENYGVYRYDSKSFTNFYKKDGLNTNGMLSIFEDREGRFWFGGWGGLFRYYALPDGRQGTSFFNVTKDGPWH